LAVSTLVDAKVFPVVVEPETFVIGDVVAALIDTIASSFAILPLSVVDVAVNVDNTALSVLTVVLPHATIS